MSAAAVNDVDNDLSRLYDSINLTGRVVRLGDCIGAGGCADVYEARLISCPAQRPSSDGASHLTTSSSSPIKHSTNTSNGDCISSLETRFRVGAPSKRKHKYDVSDEGKRVAVKVVREAASSAGIVPLGKRLVREVRAWSKLHHRNVLRLLGFTYGFVPNSRLASLVSEWMPYGTSGSYLENRSAEERIRVLTGIADGLSYLHRHDVVHGDLKGDNVMIDGDFEPRISDFGLSKLLDEVNTNTLTQNIGSVRWTARELLMDQHSVTLESDIWAFGMLALELFTNAPPYAHLKKDAQIIVCIYKGELPARPSTSPLKTSAFGRLGMGMHKKGGVPMDDDVWDICMKCWAADPRLRPSARELSKKLWELGLKCKLRTRKRRRRTRSPEVGTSELRSSSPNGDQDRDEMAEGVVERCGSPEERLRKSPKLAQLQEITTNSQPRPSPGAHVPLRPRIRAASGSGQGSVVSTQPSTPTRAHSAVPSSALMRHRSRHSSYSNNLVDGIEGRRLFTASQSDGDIFGHLSHIHQQQQQQMQLQQTHSEPIDVSGYTGMLPESGLGLDGVPCYDTQALVLSPTRSRHSSGYGTPSQLSFVTHAHNHGPIVPQQYDFNQDHIYPELGQRNYNLGSGATHAFGDQYAQAQVQSHASHGAITDSEVNAYDQGIYNSLDAQRTAQISSQWASIPLRDINASSSSSHSMVHPNPSDYNHTAMQVYQRSPLTHSHSYPSYSSYSDSYNDLSFSYPDHHFYESATGSLSQPSDISQFSCLPRTTYHTMPRNVFARRLLGYPDLGSQVNHNFNHNHTNSADNSPNIGDSVPSPHALGPLFSESFVYEAPVHTSPLMLDESLPVHHSPNHSVRASPQNQAVDFNSMRKGILSPALSDVSAPTPNLPYLPGPSTNNGRTRFPSISRHEIPSQDILSGFPPLGRRQTYPDPIDMTPSPHPDFSETPVIDSLNDDFDVAFQRYDGEEFALFGGYEFVDNSADDKT